jgi:hypothetical protein
MFHHLLGHDPLTTVATILGPLAILILIGPILGANLIRLLELLEHLKRRKK